MSSSRRQQQQLRLTVTPRAYHPSFPSTPSTASTPSKRRRGGGGSSSSSSSSTLSSLVFILFSLRSLYSLLPFLRSTPSSFSLFPFSFLVSLLSLLSLLSLSSPPKTLTLTLTPLRPLALRSALLALVLLLRFHSLRYCAASAAILADLAGSLLASSLRRLRRRLAGIASLAAALAVLSLSWDRTGCFPLSLSLSSPDEACSRLLLPILLPFLAGFLGFFERDPATWPSLRPLGRRRALLSSLALATAMLFAPAAITLLIQGVGVVSVGDLGWPLINTVLFGVILNEKYADDERVKDFQRDFLVTFFSTLLLELFYFPKLSLPGFCLCGFLLWIAVRELGPSTSGYFQLGESPSSDSIYSLVMKPIRHILTERKSRKIALFLLINTAYMVVEFVAGFMSNSLGLISDACHMLFDCAALAIGLYASYISRLPANNQFNYGRGRFEVLSGFANAVLLVLVGVLIVLESLERILDPQEISTNSLLVVSVGGLVVNIVGLVFFHEEHHHAHGGGTCSHSHSHSHSDSHNHHADHHDHDHHVDHQNHQHHVIVSHETSHGHSLGDHNHNSCNHGGHHHDKKDGIEIVNNFGRLVDHLDNDSHSLEHGHHRHDHDHPLYPLVHTHQESAKNEHKYTGDGSYSDGHCSQGHTHDHGDKEGCGRRDPQNMSLMSNHAHNHSSLAKEASGKRSTPKELKKHRHIDHNMEGIFLHVLADTMGSVGVVISTLLIKYKGWLAADPACSIFISMMIVVSVIPLLRNSAEILLQRVPRAHEQDFRIACDDLMRIRGVCGVRNVHMWNLTNTETVGTLNLHVSAETDKVSVKKRASDVLHEAGIKDITIQVEHLK